MIDLTLEQLRIAKETGAFESAKLVGNGPIFELVVATRQGLARLVLSKSKKPRQFTSPVLVLKLLKDLGIKDAKVDTEDWRPGEAKPLKRPDRSEAMKTLHNAAFVRQIQARLDASENDKRIPHDEVMSKAKVVIDKARERHN